MNDYSYTQNREISWLRFNERVLEEAIDPAVPLFERLKFISIFTSNLDEFFMIRVGSLSDLLLVGDKGVDSKSGMNAKEQLDAIHRQVRKLISKKDKIYKELEEELRKELFAHVRLDELTAEEEASLAAYFQSFVRPVLSPQIIGSHHPFPHLENLKIHIALGLQKKDNFLQGIIPLPASLPRVYFLNDAHTRYLLMEEVIYHFADQIFDHYTVTDKSIFCITRNADINTDDSLPDEDYDYRNYMKKILKKRARLAPVRLEHTLTMSPQTLRFFQKKLGLTPENSYASQSPFDLQYAFSLESEIPVGKAKRMKYQQHQPAFPNILGENTSVTDAIREKDRLLYYPYENIDFFLEWIKEAANDPEVISIHITIYRLARNSKLVEYLIKAAENGKDVIVLMELRARFDEGNNINWSEELMEAGVKVFYGFDDYKAHSKICLVTYIRDNRLHTITQIGTGNYNESTSKQYTDLSLMTAHPGIGSDATRFFQDMLLGNLDGQYAHLLASPYTLKSAMLALIDEQILQQQEHGNGYIRLKLNSLTDREIIDALMRASQAGVKVKMIIRGICCLLPGIPGKTENIEIRSIVGRFLEHARIYAFGSGDDTEVYLSSADFMTRNTEKRVEIAAPIYDAKARKKALAIFDRQWEDTLKARYMDSDGQYLPFQNPIEQRNTQDEELRRAKQKALLQPLPSPSLRKEPPKKESLIQRLFGRFFK